ncbi:MAG: hypothetical protein ACNA7O_20405 [Rhodobacterales bacterium]
MLLEAYCRLSLRLKSWSEAAHRWEMIESSGCIVDPKLQIAVAEAFLQIGAVVRAEGLLDDLRNSHAADINYKRLSGLLAEAHQDWWTAAEIWLNRGAKATGVTKINSYLRGVRALISAGDLDRAEDEAQKLVAEFPREIAYLKLYAEVAIAQYAWAVALERWQKVEAVDPAEAGAMPPEWVYQIGVENARKRTEAIRIGRLRGTGMLTLATTIQSVDEAGALLFARRARKYYAEHVREMVARLLSVNTRHSASIWWVRRLLATSAAPQKYYPTLIESLLKSSRLEECEAVVAEYLERYSKDNLWLRAMVEIHYRRSDFAAMRDVMQSATGKKLPISFKSLRVTRWIYDLIRLHPTPHTFLPEEIHEVVLQIATLYDSKFLSGSIGMLLNPSKGHSVAGEYAAQISQAIADGTDIDPLLQEEMLQFFVRRRDWGQIETLLTLPLPDAFTQQDAKKIWNIIRNKIDIRLGQADVREAEAVAVRFLDQLAENKLDGFAISLTTGLLFRLPLSKDVTDRLLACAERLGFTQMADRIADWNRRYVGFDIGTVQSNVENKRCFIVGNAPSIANLPLAALAGEDIFCVNRGMRALDVGLPQPKYLVVADPHVYKSHAQEIDADGASVEQFFVASNCLWRKPPTLPVIPLGSSGLKLSLAPFRHAPLHFHRGETVVVLAAQIAHLMGYKEIYIIGVDLDYSGPVTHFYGGGRKETERLANFRPGGSGTEMVNLAFASLQKVVEGDGCRLYNAAPAGKLDMLERVNFYDVLGLPRPQDDTGYDTLIERAAQ